MPYFKWILPLFERKGEKKREVGCRKNGLCRGAVMKGRDMRSFVSRSVIDEGALQKLRMCLLERNTARKIG